MQGTASDSAIEGIATARCELLAKCNNVGPRLVYETKIACLDDNRKAKADLRSALCAGGVDQTRLDACLVEIRAEQCGNLSATVAKMTKCSTDALCGN